MLDAVTIEILWSRITSIVDEAAKVIIRTSFSTLSNEANDFACVLTDAMGQSLAQNTGSIPSFIGTLPATVRHFLGEFGPDSPDGGMQDGDVYITNNPWQGTGHLPDVCVAKPVFRNGRLVAFAAACSHVPDIGGMVRSVEPREVFEEGLHIPLMRFMRNGVADATHNRRPQFVRGGDRIVLGTPGGGGFGSANLRSTADRERDQKMGYVER